VGVSRNGAAKRFKEHCRQAKNGSVALIHKAMRKYGVNDFSVHVIGSALTWQDAVKIEIAAITEYSTLVPRGYNLTEGGEGTVGYKHTTVAKMAMSDKHKGKVISAESRHKMSVARKGKPKPEGFGTKVAKSNSERVLSDVTKQKLAAHLLNTVQSPEFKVKIAAANSARVITCETRLRLSAAATGRKHRAPEIEKIAQANSRRVWTPEMRANMSAALRKALARPEVKSKMAATNRRRVWTDESRARMSAAVTAAKAAKRRNATIETTVQESSV